MTLIPGELYLATDNYGVTSHILITVGGDFFFVDSHGVYYGSDDGIEYTPSTHRETHFLTLKKLF